jgi:RNA polymerase sigma factor (sigma-70 family)
MLRRDPFANPELIHRVYAYVAYRIGDGPEAEDVTSEVFERALRYRDSYRPEKGEPAAWLIGIARRCLATPRPRSESLEATSEEVVSSADVEAETMRRLEVQGAVRELGDRDRELIALRYGADLSARRIGELLELETNAVEVALHRALDRLRGKLEPETKSSKESAPPAVEGSEPNAGGDRDEILEERKRAARSRG